MPTKKKSKAKKAVEVASPPDLRDVVPPTPANLAAALKELKAVLADIPIPEPVPVMPEPQAPSPQVVKHDNDKHDNDGHDNGGESGDSSQPQEAEAKPAKPVEPIMQLPQLDYIDAMLHMYFAAGLPCGYGQEVRRRIEESYVDRNEFRVTEAFEVEEMLSDLEIPDLFDRCLAVRESVAQVYNDQNGVHLTFLRDAGISERSNFYQRVPALQHHVVVFLNHMLAIEEVCFSEKSTARAQQRLGLDPKDSAVAKFVDELRACMKPYGHVPVSIGPHGKNGKPNLKHNLSPACILARLAPFVKPKHR